MLKLDYSKKLNLDQPLDSLVTWNGDFIIARNRVFGESKNQQVLDHLSKEKKKKKKSRKLKGVEEGEGGKSGNALC